MKQPGVIVTLIGFIAAVSFVLAAQQEQGRVLSVQLSDTSINSKVGDPDGKRTLKLNLQPSENKICYELSVAGLSGVSRVQISSGSMDQPGTAIVSFSPISAANANDCATLGHDQVMNLVRSPENYYATVENEKFPSGAIRGQLFKEFSR
ncbi:MAG TPA: CHRD domain-containing protein [Pyrinomonadaceae bacterium]|jgi:hypothetical protein|nr:CHRD domain-containing protein [Pyrinomonadaceae bacterium]